MSLRTKLSSSTTVGRYRELELAGNRAALGRFVLERFTERYFAPIESTPTAARNGFSMMAVSCLVIETLESFYEGLPDTRNRSAEMFRNFLGRETPLKPFGAAEIGSSSTSDAGYYIKAKLAADGVFAVAAYFSTRKIGR